MSLHFSPVAWAAVGYHGLYGIQGDEDAGYGAHIWRDGKRTDLGEFDTLHQAVDACWKFENERNTNRVHEG